MWLLQYSESEEHSIYSFDDGNIPPYAILSHTWGADDDEVTFADLQTGSGKTKPGYEKILFCGEQARQDDLQYFWIDTCCIDKSNKAELSQAIRSMFCWYRNAAKCYVYLSDVSTKKQTASSMFLGLTWEPAFRSSRWFTRGWTLQELLAPSIVEFFSQEGEKLGDKTSLKMLIHEITGIPHEALNGTPLSHFDVNERLRWKGDRKTKWDEDAWYSLSGVFGVEIAPAYSEGAASAFRRLMDEIEKLERCVQDMHITDPYHDKKRIEDTKGGLLADSYRWVLSNITFRQWQQDSHSRLLWIKGDPGKGKTMLLCGIINELQSLIPRTALLSYFFCQATDSRINTATAVLRGLLYMLVKQQPRLISHVRRKHNSAGKALFEDANAWVALTEIFPAVLRDTGLSTTYLIIDALDECIIGQLELLSFIAEQSSTFSRVKWIVSSRNWPAIEEQLDRAEHITRLSLELNAESLAAAVKVFIQQKVRQLVEEKRYTLEVQDAVLQHLTSNANDTFLWVALVCQDLKATPKWNALKKLAQFPPGLDSLYKRMLQHISESDSAEICLQVLAVTAVLYRPITVAELVVLTKQLADFVDDLESAREIIGLCGSFLTLRDNTVYFVHQSAKDFLITKASKEVFLDGIESVHQDIFAKSLTVLHKTLHRDIYNLQALGYPIGHVKSPPSNPLAVSRYPCVYWIDHFCDSKHQTLAHSATTQEDTKAIDAFFRQRYIYWLEALSLCRSMAKGVVSITRLWHSVQGLGDADALNKIVYDARRFIMYHKEAIENYPLQAYASALLFSPADSIIRRLFQHEEPRGIEIKPAINNSWSACLQTLEGHSNCVTSVAVSHDSARVASASSDKTIKIWDTSSGTCVHTLEGHNNSVTSVAFSHDSARLASASSDKTIKVWDTSSGTCIYTLEGHNDIVRSVAFSHDSTRLASTSNDRTVKVWDTSSRTCLRTLKGHSIGVNSVAFSHDSARLASASSDKTIRIWDAGSGTCLHTLKGRSSVVRSVAFSHDSAWLASVSSDRAVRIWNTNSGTCIYTLEGHNDIVRSVAFSHDSTWLVSASSDKTIKIWDARSRTCLYNFESHSSVVKSVAFSHDSAWLASASSDRTVKIWDTSSGAYLHTLKGHESVVRSVAFSHDSVWLASASSDKTIKIWDTSSRRCLHTLKGHSNRVNSVAFSHDSAWLASASSDKTIKIWDARSGTCLHTLKGHKLIVRSVAFSHDSAWLASVSRDRTVRIWDTNSRTCLYRFEGGRALREISFDPTNILLCTERGTITISRSQITDRIDVAELRSQYQSTGLSLDRTWIMRSGCNILWIPSEYRPSSSAVSGTKLGMGVGLGRVWLCQVT